MPHKFVEIKARENPSGFQIKEDGRAYHTVFPKHIWSQTPAAIRKIIVSNFTLAFTNFFPLLLGGDKIKYDFDYPLFESQMFRNQLYDLLFSEKVDRVKFLSYLRKFYNLEYEFNSNQSEIPDLGKSSYSKNSQPTAIIPFTFGKESLASFALCLELGIKPVLVYSQEPSQPFEEKYKRKKLQEIAAKYKVPIYFLRNDAGLFRNGKLFRYTELGWGTQTTALCLMMIPFAYAHRADYILIGNEYSNNDQSMLNGWKVYSSYDQTSFWTAQQNNMVRLLTGGHCQVKSTFEPLEEINIFYLLHHRYPELGQDQFSCCAEKPLAKNSQWCHDCYKCTRMYLFAAACGIEPASIGYKKNILQEPGHFKNYFGKECKTGSSTELDFAFYALYRRNYQSPYVSKFINQKLKHLKPWKWYLNYYCNQKKALNLPIAYEKRMLKIFASELADFKKAIISQ